MKRFCTIVLAILFTCAAFGVQAQEESKVKTIADYAKLGSGVYNPKTNDQGEIQSLIVVGTARISTVLGASKGKQIARKKASMEADAQLVEYLKKNIEVVATSEEESIFVLQGKENGEEEALDEEGKGTETEQKKILEYAKQTVRGLQVLYFEINKEDKEYIIVKGLDWKHAEAVKKAAKKLADDSTDEATAELGGANADGSVPESKKEALRAQKGELKNESHAAPEAESFL